MLAQARSTWRAFPPIPAREDCTICQGTGWELMPSSGTARARRCPCVALARVVRLKERIRIPQRYEHCTLESFQPRTLSQTHALAEAWKFAERFPQTDGGLVFVGRPGVGKTHLAIGIALELLQRFQEDILFLDFQTLPGLRGPLGRGTVYGNPYPARLRTVSLLVLDDFGAQSASQIQYQTALQIIQARMRAKKPTLCTSARLEGLSPNGEEEPEASGNTGGTRGSAFHQAHALVLGGFRIVLMRGEDYRQRNAFPSSLF